jgi:hypothetical protein
MGAVDMHFDYSTAPVTHSRRRCSCSPDARPAASEIERDDTAEDGGGERECQRHRRTAVKRQRGDEQGQEEQDRAREYDFPQALHGWAVPAMPAAAGKAGIEEDRPLLTTDVLHSIRDIRDGALQVIRVIGDSMSNLLLDGYKVLVDTRLHSATGTMRGKDASCSKNTTPSTPPYGSAIAASGFSSARSPKSSKRRYRAAEPAIEELERKSRPASAIVTADEATERRRYGALPVGMPSGVRLGMITAPSRVAVIC